MEHKLRLRILTAAAALAVIFAANGPIQAATPIEPQGPASPPAVESGAPTAPEFERGQVLVKFKPGTTRAKGREIAGRFGTTPEEQLNDLNVRRLIVPEGKEEATIEAMRADPDVEYAGPNYLRHIFTQPNDMLFPNQTNLVQINAPAGWDIFTGGSNVTIAVVDTGVDLGHPDLAAKLLPGASFVQGVTSPNDDQGHGTNVAGIAAAITNNGIGIAGVSWGAKILPVKVLDSTGYGDDAMVANGIIWAADQGARVLNLSLGGDTVDPVLGEAVAYAQNKGALIVAAAGNCGSGGYGCKSVNPVMYPAAYPGVMAVGSVSSSNQKSYFSEYGSFVDVVAPGEFPYSTWPTYLPPFGGYDNHMEGTSQATPHVAGLAALIWSFNPSLTASQVKSIIETTATDLGTPGRDDYYGNGLINVSAALHSMAPVAALSVAPTVIAFAGDATHSAPARSITISNTSSLTMTWTITGTKPAWLSLSKGAGSVAANSQDSVTASVITGVAPGFYSTSLTVNSYFNSALMGSSTVTVSYLYGDILRFVYLPLTIKSYSGGW